MVIEKELMKLCQDTIKLLTNLEREGLITKDELEYHLEKKLQFIQCININSTNISRPSNKTF